MKYIFRTVIAKDPNELQDRLNSLIGYYEKVDIQAMTEINREVYRYTVVCKCGQNEEEDE